MSKLSQPTITVLGQDPTNNRVCRINCYAFQQDAILSFRGWQYAAFYSPVGDAVFIHLARRQLPNGPWETLVFDDYPQTVDDGHNTVQIGICSGDGTIHLSYDHHCDVLHYRHSRPNLTTNPSSFTWTSSLFSPNLNHLPGIDPSHKPFHYVTYPRFCSPPPSSSDTGLLFTLRDGKAGLGNDHLYTYSPLTHTFSYLGQHLTGVASNPYIHGLNLTPSQSHENRSRLHITWVYRAFVHYPGWDDPLDTKHKTQAGPNGAENNFDICYAYSDDSGLTWFNGSGKQIADLRAKETVDNTSEGIVAFEIPKGSGLTNQEAQAVDSRGGVHVLNRDNLPSDDDKPGYGKVRGDGDIKSDGNGKEKVTKWKHYHRNSSTATWRQTPLRPVHGNTRGRLAVWQKTGDLFIILPNSDTKGMHILRATAKNEYQDYEEVWSGKGFMGEPLVDSAQLEEGGDNVLSLMVLADAGGEGKRDVVVLDFPLSPQAVQLGKV
ncbi:hypothetical protein QBC35DRAFT_550888 [Podospora australis]|uniref:Dockerin type 1 n=1 Tax=Podospora australis TaxID=1536484 RepID=A0AAN6WT85_9PEZI|nr:hypothetical protein QBC35DRAFT_550888 [Podospora australis]